MGFNMLVKAIVCVCAQNAIGLDLKPYYIIVLKPFYVAPSLSILLLHSVYVSLFAFSTRCHHYKINGGYKLYHLLISLTITN